MPTRRLALASMTLALACMAALPLVDLFDVSWHDQQRIGQVAVLAYLVLVTVALHARTRGAESAGAWTLPLGTLPAGLLVAIAAVGLVSVSLARQPLWALAEWSLFVLHLHLAATIFWIRRLCGTIVDALLFWVLAFVCAGLAAQFLLAYLAALGGESTRLDAWLLFSGFSNVRFFGQFQTLTLPLLALPLMASGPLRRYALPAAALGAIWWAMAIASGTRGTWLAIAVTMAAFWWLGPVARRWVAVQSGGFVLGIGLFAVLFHLVPHLLAWEVGHAATERLNASLSAREVIWGQALEMIALRPWLGYGPMHFADIPNPVGSHPHQAWLQWAAEWGLPSALALTWLLGRGGIAVARVLRSGGGGDRDPLAATRACVAAALLAAVMQSMVDGVIVMPYPQFWLAVLVGWSIALHPRNPAPIPPEVLRAWFVVATIATAVLVHVVVRDVPRLQAREVDFARSPIGSQFQPRFWLQGVISERAAEQR